MARTEQEIINDMGALPEEITEQPNTEMAGWRLLAARAIRFIEQLWDKHEERIENILQQRQYGSLQWYYHSARAFQMDDQLIVSDDGTVGYAEINTDKQIIQQCAVTAQNGVVRIKVAKTDNNDLAPLNDTEYAAFVQYIEAISPADVHIIVISTVPDQVNITGHIIMASGYMPTQVVDSCKAALAYYRDNLGFDALLTISGMYNALTTTTGVLASVIDILEWNSPDFGSQFTEITSQQMHAGYFNWNNIDLRIYNQDNQLVDQITAL